MQPGRRHSLTATFALAWTIATVAATAPAGDGAAQLFARGDCTGALRVARDAIAGVDAAHGAQSPGSADALARFSRIALDCHRPDAAGLEDALSRELALRERDAGPAGAAAIEVQLMQAKRAMQLNRIDPALALVQAVRDEPQFASMAPALRARVLGLLASLYNQRADAQRLGQRAGWPRWCADRPAAIGNPDRCVAGSRHGLGSRARAKALVPLGEAETLARGRSARAVASTPICAIWPMRSVMPAISAARSAFSRRSRSECASRSRRASSRRARAQSWADVESVR